MSNNRDNLTPERRERIRRRRRVLLWVLGGTVLLLLANIVSQQLWLWTVVRPDTASDALVLYALSTLNFVAFVVFLFIFVRNLLKLRLESKDAPAGLFHLHQLSADLGDGGFFIPVSQPLAREVVQPFSRRDRAAGCRSQTADAVEPGSSAARHGIVARDASECGEAGRSAGDDAAGGEFGAVGSCRDRDEGQLRGCRAESESIAGRRTATSIPLQRCGSGSEWHQSRGRKRVCRARGASESHGNADHRDAEPR